MALASLTPATRPVGATDAAPLLSQNLDHESQALDEFRRANADLFGKSDLWLALHLAVVLTLLGLGTWAIVVVPLVWVKILLGPVNAFLWFCLGNVTVHHHHTHHNAAKSAVFKRLLDGLHFLVVPDGGRGLKRYRRAHMNHHLHPLSDSDVDHRYAQKHYQKMSKSVWTRIVYFLELTFIGGHVPGQKDEAYLNRVPIAKWNLAEYEKVKEREVRKAKRNSLIAWGIFLVVLFVFPPLAWAWIYPLILVRNWNGFLGQFQHYDEKLLASGRSKHNRTLTFRIPGWLNYLAGGEISGHFIHHIYPDMPYYHVESARRRLLRQPELVRLVVNH
ncbi:MAG TPA: fatty acid desaturase [Pirellulaceae bacterium]|nr:fatty acid desaturase [Pirellulaceae bacterium]